MQTAPKGAAANQPKGKAEDKHPLDTPSGPTASINLTAQLVENDLLAQLDRARDRLDASVQLLDLALDLRESLWWQCDLDVARADVDALNYAVEAHRWWRSQ